jgi:hypothetical protein
MLHHQWENNAAQRRSCHCQTPDDPTLLPEPCLGLEFPD